MKKKLLNIIFMIAYLFVSYTVFFLLINYCSFLHYSIDLMVLFSVFNIFIALHFIFDLKKMYNFIYMKRYIIGLILLIIVVVGKYNGSSVPLWNNYIEPKYEVGNKPILGKNRAIRSDEWLVNSPMNLSQATPNVNFSSYNNLLGGKKNLVTFYPNLPSKDISILATPQNILYFFLDKEMAFSFSWYFPYFLLFFTSFELCMILTKKKILSVAGSFLITLSPLIQWWQSPHIVAYGNLAMILIFHFLKSESNIKKILLSIGIGYTGFLYIMCMYPAWQIPYGYCYLAIILWLIMKNKKQLKLKNLLYVLLIIGVIVGLLTPLLMQNRYVLNIMSNTAYPGKRVSTGGDGHWQFLITYVLDIFFPYKNLGNPCEYSQYFSFFPIPTLYAFYLLIKSKKKDFFIIASSLIILILFIWTIVPLPGIFSRASLLYMSTTARTNSAIGYMSVIQLIYILGNYSCQIKKINWKYLLFIFTSVIIIVIIGVRLSNGITEKIFPGYVNLYTSIISVAVFSPILSMIIINNKKTYIPLCLSLISISILSGAIVSPVNKGLAVMYNKPFAKQIRRISNKNPNARFIAVDSGITLSNYIVANGGRTLNSVNYLPNMKLYKVLDPKLEYVDVYNRYEHVAVDLIDGKTKFILNTPDFITIKLDFADVCKMHTNYIITINDNVKRYSSLKRIYGKDNIIIYQTNCK